LLPTLATALLWGAAAGSGAAEAPLAVPIDTPAFRAPLAGIGPGSVVHFATAPPRQLPLDQLVRWGALAETDRGAQLVLADGGLVVADVLGIDKQQLEVESELLGTVRFPLELLAGVLFQPPTDTARRDQLLGRLAQGADHDRLVLSNGDELSGTLQGLAASALTLQTDVGKVEVELLRAAALILARAAPPAAKERVVVGLADGSRLVARSLAATDGQLLLRLAGDLELTVELRAVVALQPWLGKVVYLSDLKPAGYRHVPFLQTAWPFRADHNVLEGRLRAGGELRLKGLGMHSAARLTYELDQPYRKFQAEVAIDDRAAERGSVEFRVYVDDGSGRWQPRYDSGVVRGGQAPQPVEVDLAGVKRLSLLVDFGQRGDERDYANWLDARLIKP
jgi:hypothetical protein